MDFELSDEQRMWQAAVHDFIAREVRPRAHEVDEEARFNWEATRKMGALGLLGLNAPEEYGGAGVDPVSAAIAIEELGWGCGSTALAISAHNGLGCAPIVLFGNEEQKRYCREFYKNTLLPDQMATDGSFPKETKRTKPYNYSLFNLDAMIMVCQILSSEKDNLWLHSTEDSRNIKLAMDFMFPFIKDKKNWPFEPDVMYYEFWPVRHPSLLFAGLAFDEQKYIHIWNTLEPDPTNEEVIRNFPIRQPILWVN